MINKTIYKPNLKEIEAILNHPQIYAVLPGSKLGLVKKAAGLMANQLKKSEQAIKEEEINQIKGALNTLSFVVMEKPVTPILRDLVNGFIILSAAWNEAIAQKLEIREMIYSLRRLIDFHLSFGELVAASKTLVKKIEEIQKFSPPAFEISKHYLKAIQELDLKGGKKIKSPRAKFSKTLDEEPPQC